MHGNLTFLVSWAHPVLTQIQGNPLCGGSEKLAILANCDGYLHFE